MKRYVTRLYTFTQKSDLENVQNVAEVFTLQTAHMRSMFREFPEVLLIDATHCTNKHNYKLFSFMVHDTFGHGQHVLVSGAKIVLKLWRNIFEPSTTILSFGHNCISHVSISTH